MPRIIDEAELSFRERLRIRRVAARLTQTEVAGDLGIDTSTLSNYETGKRSPADWLAFDLRHREAVERLQKG